MFNLSAREILITLNGGKLEHGTGFSHDIKEAWGIRRNLYNVLHFRTKFPTRTCSSFGSNVTTLTLIFSGVIPVVYFRTK